MTVSSILGSNKLIGYSSGLRRARGRWSVSVSYGNFLVVTSISGSKGGGGTSGITIGSGGGGGGGVRLAIFFLTR